MHHKSGIIADLHKKNGKASAFPFFLCNFTFQNNSVFEFNPVNSEKILLDVKSRPT